ncbi:hypothetical protein NLI96_g6103 [Meripilus lineatus]|uniref:Uncharacterized protein n=1 Tax=Meripilus lineatus TaxID=2056292 RepID=A0AAD5V6W0_9APHY|nr:hypothetical protein NLI96_g6103 [Physisporinus lineatus]
MVQGIAYLATPFSLSPPPPPPPNNAFPIDRSHHSGSQKIDDPEFDPIAEDWAVIEVDPSKINASNFKGNILDLGEKLSSLKGSNC